MGASQDAIPEVTSLPEKLTDRPWLCQPLASGARDGDALACGSVASYLSPNEREPVFPALSVHDPLTDAFALSGPEYALGASHESTCDVASLPANVTVTPWLYQPFESTGRDGVVVT